MFIETEPTPNPETLKFLPGRAVMPAGNADFVNATEAADSPLALRLFAVDGVRAVFLGRDFISVTKAEDRDWFTLRPPVLGALVDHFASGEPVVADASSATPAVARDWGEDQPIVDAIEELLAQRVRPSVAQDGGDIVFRGFEAGTVYLELRGACSGCPSSTATLKSGVENLLRHYVPEVNRVEAVTG